MINHTHRFPIIFRFSAFFLSFKHLIIPIKEMIKTMGFRHHNNKVDAAHSKYRVLCNTGNLLL